MWINSNKRVLHCMVQYRCTFLHLANFFIIFNKDKNESLFDYKNICIDPLN
jgi:hypothetical protein